MAEAPSAMNYYYFAATLPLLSMEEPPPFTPAQFQQRCREHLNAADQAALEALLNPELPTGNTVVQRWRDIDVQIRNAVAHARGIRLGRDASPYLRPTSDLSHGIAKACADALLRHNPLERERALDRLRWHQAEELAGSDAFSIRALLAYAVKLGLAHRWSEMSEEKGREKLESLARQSPAGAGIATATA